MEGCNPASQLQLGLGMQCALRRACATCYSQTAAGWQQACTPVNPSRPDTLPLWPEFQMGCRALWEIR
jgi:hypothetical protein